MLTLLAPHPSGVVLQANYDVDAYRNAAWIDGYPEDFEFIERACNSHDDLVAALIEAREELCRHKRSEQDGSHNHDVEITLKTIDSAIAKAEGVLT